MSSTNISGPQERTQVSSRSDRIGLSQKSDDPPIVLDDVLQSRLNRVWLKDDREIGLDDQAIFESFRAFIWTFREVFSVVHTYFWAERKRGRAWEREKGACKGGVCEGFTKVAPSKGSVRLLRSSSLLFEGFEGVYFSKKKRFSTASGGSKRSDGSLPASGGSKRSSGSLPHRVGGKSVFLLISPMDGGKRSRQEPGRSSISKSDPRFLNAEDKAGYARYKSAWITLSKSINPATLSYPDFENLLHLSTTGDKIHNLASDPDFNWTPVNQFLRNTATPFHNGFTSGLGKDARTIQHVLRSSVIPKAGDRIHITPLLSLTTFYIMAHREFNASDLIIRYFKNLTTIRDPRHHRKPNLALGHLISYVLTIKYNLEFPSTSTSPTHHPKFFSNNSFHILHNTRRAGEEAEEAQPEQVPDPVLALAPLCQHS
ncbi:hypothetical protein M5K25_002479 [Dendrobium thyrsiflorum]|uniref:Uncharacterized protein n=1 Tax=Dendrobium thyrsiflorum TaxID=117978 RepID=A0ABD0VUY9_DENTH